MAARTSAGRGLSDILLYLERVRILDMRMHGMIRVICALQPPLQLDRGSGSKSSLPLITCVDGDGRASTWYMTGSSSLEASYRLGCRRWDLGMDVNGLVSEPTVGGISGRPGVQQWATGGLCIALSIDPSIFVESAVAITKAFLVAHTAAH